MATCVSNSNEGRVSPREGVNHESVSMVQGQARAGANLWKSIGSGGFHPVVKVTPAEPVKRLGTGWQWWFSESVYVPTGSKIEFRFQGPTHLLALYNEGARKSGETSIDDLHSSNLRSFVHKLTFVPAGCAYRERHETGAATRVTFLYLDPAAFRKSDDGECRLKPRYILRILLCGRQPPN
jgi:AraC family transcriptional regulator